MPKYCQWCGHNIATDEHHLFRRSAEPHLINDENNKIALCRRCHDYATNTKSFEVLLQDYFFLKNEQVLSISKIADKMKEIDTVAPADLSRWRMWLGGEYGTLNTRLNELEAVYPERWNMARESVNSDKQADRLLDATDYGKEMSELKRTIKTIEKMMSAIKSSLDRLNFEARNQY